MKLTGKIVSVSTNFITKKNEINLSVNEPVNHMNGYEEMTNFHSIKRRFLWRKDITG